MSGSRTMLALGLVLVTACSWLRTAPSDGSAAVVGEEASASAVPSAPTPEPTPAEIRTEVLAAAETLVDPTPLSSSELPSSTPTPDASPADTPTPQPTATRTHTPTPEPTATAALGQVRIVSLSCATDPEVVEIKNEGGAVQPLSSWWLVSDPIDDQRLDLGGRVGSLVPGATIRVYSYSNAPDDNPAAGQYRWTRNPVFRNTGHDDYAALLAGSTTVHTKSC